MPKLAQQQSLTKEEVNGLQIFADNLAYLSHYYATIPYISIQSKLYASLLTQQNRVKETDNFDFHQTSQILPCSTYFLTDSSLKHRLITNPLKLDDEYGVKIYSMQEIGNLITDFRNCKFWKRLRRPRPIGIISLKRGLPSVKLEGCTKEPNYLKKFSYCKYINNLI